MKFSHLAFSLAILPTILSAQTLAHRSNEWVAGRPAAAGEIILKLRNTGASQATLRQFGPLLGPPQQLGHGAMRFRSSTHTATNLLRQLRSNPAVEWAEPNYVVSAASTPGDPYFSQQWNLRNVRQVPGASPGADIQAVKAWDVATGSASIAIAILDTGVDYRHVDLAANIWTAPAPYTLNTGTGTLTCAAGSHGFRLLDAGVTKTCEPLDDAGHGTHVAGIIGASGNNFVGVTGINWKSTIIPIRVLDRFKNGYLSDVLLGFRAAIQLKAQGINIRVINASIDFPGSSNALDAVLAEARDNDILVVTAAGNNGLNIDTAPTSPASSTAENLLTVAATDASDTLASFSNFGSKSVDLAAPGAGVFSTLPGHDYGVYSGTSQASAHVAGAAALILSNCTLNTAQLRTLILSSVDVIPDLTGKTASAGRLNLSRALSQCQSAPKEDFTLSLSSSAGTAPQAGSTSTTLTVTPKNGFNAPVQFTATGFPSGVGVAFLPPTVTGSGSTQLTIALQGGVPRGTYPIKITGFSGTLTAAATFNLTVTGPDFRVSLPSASTITAGGTVSIPVTLEMLDGFSGPVALSLWDLPPGVTGTLNPSSLSGNGTVALNLSATAAAQPRVAPITVMAVSGAVSRTAVSNLTVVALNTTPLPSPTSLKMIAPAALALGESGAIELTLPAPSAAGTTVDITVSDPSIATLNTTSVYLPAGQSATARARITGTANGLVTLTATSAGLGTVSSQVKIGNGGSQLTIPVPVLPEGMVSVNYIQPLTVTGGSGLYVWSIVSGSLPPGIQITSMGLSGTPTTAGTYTFTTTAIDQTSPSRSATVTLTVKINAATATLTRVTPNLQEIIVGYPVAPMTVQLTNAQGNPVAGAPVTFTTTLYAVNASDALPAKIVYTDASGLASIQIDPPTGGQAIAVYADSPGVAHAVPFAVKVLPDPIIGPVPPPASTLSPVGNRQLTVAPGAAIPLVKVIARDTGGEIIVGLHITFTASYTNASGTSATPAQLVNTDAAGQASVQLPPPAADVTGISVAVQAFGIPQGVTFTINISNTTPPPVTPPTTPVTPPIITPPPPTPPTGIAATVTAVSSTLQTVPVGGAIAPFVVAVKTTAGIPIVGHAVTFTTIYVDGFQSANGPVQVVTTDAAGQATIQLPPPVGGLAIAVTATATGVTKTASFAVKIGTPANTAPAITVNFIAPLSPTQTARLEVMLTSPAPADGVTVMLTSSDANVLALNTNSIFIPGGQSSNARATVTGRSPGTALITVTAPSLGSAVSSITVNP